MDRTMAMDLAADAAALWETHGGRWGEHPRHPVGDWVAEVSALDTRLGYWEWVAARIENDNEEDAG